ncbi:MAG: GntR family transcriptional regulator [Acidobacteriota bacterium]
MTTHWLPQLDPQSPTPIYEQILEAVAIAVSTGALRAGDPLPSIRQLATELRLNPNTTARALRALEREGLIRGIRGIGTVVTDDAAELAGPLASQALRRELTAAVDIARRMGLGWKELRNALKEEWEDKHVD